MPEWWVRLAGNRMLSAQNARKRAAGYDLPAARHAGMEAGVIVSLPVVRHAPLQAARAEKPGTMSEQRDDRLTTAATGPPRHLVQFHKGSRHRREADIADDL
jgi:hypothetical protein